MKKILLVIGHDYKDKGAYHIKHERDICMEVATELFKQEQWNDIDLVLKSRNNSYTNLPKEINEWNPNYIIELHLNAVSNPNVQGSEHLYYHTSKRGKAMAEILQKHCIKEFKLKDRGLKPINQGDRGANILKNTKAPCVIAEPFFITAINTEAEFKELIQKYVAYLKDSIREIVDKAV